jgi:hypothetical protein
MKVGDLVAYAGIIGNKRLGVGIVLSVSSEKFIDGKEHYSCKIQWANGVISSHPNGWLIRLESSEDL